MEKEKLERFLNKTVKILSDAGNGKVFSYSGKITEVTADDISLFSERFGDTIISNQLVLQITESKGKQHKPGN